MALGRVGDRDVIVSGGVDGTVRVWDAGAGRPVGEPLTGHTREVMWVALGRIGDRDVIVTGSDDDTVRVWDGRRQQAPTVYSDRQSSHSVATRSA